MKRLPNAMLEAWKALREYGANIYSDKPKGDFFQLLNDLKSLETGKARIIRTLDFSKTANTEICLDELNEGDEVILFTENIISVSEQKIFPIFLKTNQGMSAILDMFGLQDGAKDEDAIVVFNFDHLVSQNEPVIFSDIISRVIQFHSKGRMTIQDGWNVEANPTASNPGEKVEIIRLYDLSISIYVKFIGQYGLRLIVHKAVK